MNIKCAHCGTETPEAMVEYGELHHPDCPVTVARKIGNAKVMSIDEIIAMGRRAVGLEEPQPDPEQDRNSRSVLLDEAGALIDGQRAKDYGDAHENFDRISHGWSEILGIDVTSVQVALCMDWLKTCRLITSPGHRDSWIDKLGYTALGGEVSAL